MAELFKDTRVRRKDKGIGYGSNIERMKCEAVKQYLAKSNAPWPKPQNQQEYKHMLLDLFRDLYSPTVQLTDIGGCITYVSDSCSSPNLSSVDPNEAALDYDFSEESYIYSSQDKGSSVTVSLSDGKVVGNLQNSAEPAIYYSKYQPNMPVPIFQRGATDLPNLHKMLEKSRSIDEHYCYEATTKNHHSENENFELSWTIPISSNDDSVTKQQLGEIHNEFSYNGIVVGPTTDKHNHSDIGEIRKLDVELCEEVPSAENAVRIDHLTTVDDAKQQIKGVTKALMIPTSNCEILSSYARLQASEPVQSSAEKIKKSNKILKNYNMPKRKRALPLSTVIRQKRKIKKFVNKAYPIRLRAFEEQDVNAPFDFDISENDVPSLSPVKDNCDEVKHFTLKLLEPNSKLAAGYSKIQTSELQSMKPTAKKQSTSAVHSNEEQTSMLSMAKSSEALSPDNIRNDDSKRSGLKLKMQRVSTRQKKVSYKISDDTAFLKINSILYSQKENKHLSKRKTSIAKQMSKKNQAGTKNRRVPKSIQRNTGAGKPNMNRKQNHLKIQHNECNSASPNLQNQKTLCYATSTTGLDSGDFLSDGSPEKLQGSSQTTNRNSPINSKITDYDFLWANVTENKEVHHMDSTPNPNEILVNGRAVSVPKNTPFQETLTTNSSKADGKSEQVLSVPDDFTDIATPETLIATFVGRDVTKSHNQGKAGSKKRDYNAGKLEVAREVSSSHGITSAAHHKGVAPTDEETVDEKEDKYGGRNHFIANKWCRKEFPPTKKRSIQSTTDKLLSLPNISFQSTETDVTDIPDATKFKFSHSKRLEHLRKEYTRISALNRKLIELEKIKSTEIDNLRKELNVIGNKRKEARLLLLHIINTGNNIWEEIQENESQCTEPVVKSATALEDGLKVQDPLNKELSSHLELAIHEQFDEKINQVSNVQKAVNGCIESTEIKQANSEQENHQDEREIRDPIQLKLSNLQSIKSDSDSNTGKDWFCNSVQMKSNSTTKLFEENKIEPSENTVVIPSILKTAHRSIDEDKLSTSSECMDSADKKTESSDSALAIKSMACSLNSSQCTFNEAELNPIDATCSVEKTVVPGRSKSLEPKQAKSSLSKSESKVLAITNKVLSDIKQNSIEISGSTNNANTSLLERNTCSETYQSSNTKPKIQLKIERDRGKGIGNKNSEAPRHVPSTNTGPVPFPKSKSPANCSAHKYVNRSDSRKESELDVTIISVSNPESSQTKQNSSQHLKAASPILQIKESNEHKKFELSNPEAKITSDCMPLYTRKRGRPRKPRIYQNKVAKVKVIEFTGKSASLQPRSASKSENEDEMPPLELHSNVSLSFKGDLQRSDMTDIILPKRHSENETIKPNQPGRVYEKRNSLGEPQNLPTSLYIPEPGEVVKHTFQTPIGPQQIANQQLINHVISSSLVNTSAATPTHMITPKNWLAPPIVPQHRPIHNRVVLAQSKTNNNQLPPPPHYYQSIPGCSQSHLPQQELISSQLPLIPINIPTNASSACSNSITSSTAVADAVVGTVSNTVAIRNIPNTAISESDPQVRHAIGQQNASVMALSQQGHNEGPPNQSANVPICTNLHDQPVRQPFILQTPARLRYRHPVSYAPAIHSALLRPRFNPGQIINATPTHTIRPSVQRFPPHLHPAPREALPPNQSLIENGPAYLPHVYIQTPPGGQDISNNPIHKNKVEIRETNAGLIVVSAQGDTKNIDGNGILQPNVAHMQNGTNGQTIAIDTQVQQIPGNETFPNHTAIQGYSKEHVVDSGTPIAHTDGRMGQEINWLNMKCSECDTIAKFVCSGCKKKPYCSANCQGTAWLEHRQECRNRQIVTSTG